MTQEENKLRNLFFLEQFLKLYRYFLMEHKLPLERYRQNGISGFIAIHPRDHVKCTSKKAIKRMKSIISGAMFSISHVDINALTNEELMISYDVSNRLTHLVTNFREDARKIKKRGFKFEVQRLMT